MIPTIDIHRRDAEMNAQVVTDSGLTRGDLIEAFDIVADKDDWRAPIDAFINPDETDAVFAAILFFTGTTTDVSHDTFLKDGKIRIRSVGYRAGPCGP